jgi:hypothetical protein
MRGTPANTRLCVSSKRGMTAAIVVAAVLRVWAPLTRGRGFNV